MIVRNEENSLPGALESVVSVVDEIIIIDTGSIDNTLAVARDSKAIVGRSPWCNNFSYSRNKSLQAAHGDWILILDADERLNVKNPYLFLRMLHAAAPDIGGYFCTIQGTNLKSDNTIVKHRGIYPRLFRNYGYPTIKFEGVIHEQIMPSILALDKKIEYSDVLIEHFSFGNDTDLLILKVQRNYKILIKYLETNPFSSIHYYWLAQTLSQMFLPKLSFEASLFADQLCDLPANIRASNSCLIAAYLGGKRKFKEALPWIELSLELEPNQYYAKFLKACTLLYMGNKYDSKFLFLELLNYNDSDCTIPLSSYDVIFPKNIIENFLRLYEKD
jgi:glycosyltransferase involved in cell wall biosynthesis